MRVIVCGGRDYVDQAAIHRVLDDLPADAVLVTGGARGADWYAFADWLNRPGPHEDGGRVTETRRAEWSKWGKRAGPIRNQEMLDAGADLVIAFPGGKGTADMVARARKAGVEVREVRP